MDDDDDDDDAAAATGAGVKRGVDSEAKKETMVLLAVLACLLRYGIGGVTVCVVLLLLLLLLYWLFCSVPLLL